MKKQLNSVNRAGSDRRSVLRSVKKSLEDQLSGGLSSDRRAMALEPRMLLDGSMTETLSGVSGTSSSDDQVIKDAVLGHTPAPWSDDRDKDGMVLLRALSVSSSRLLSMDTSPISLGEGEELVVPLLNRISYEAGHGLRADSFRIDSPIGTFFRASSDTFHLHGVGRYHLSRDSIFTFTPFEDYTGALPDAIFTMIDNDGNTFDYRLDLVDVRPVNDAPILPTYEIVQVIEDFAVTGNVFRGSYDADGDSLTVTSFRITGHGDEHTAGSFYDVSGIGSYGLLSDGTYHFSPVADYTGVVPNLEFTISDGNGGEASGVIRFSDIANINDSPASPHFVRLSVDEDGISAGNLLTNITDPDGDTLSIVSYTISGELSPRTDFGMNVSLGGIGDFLLHSTGEYSFRPLTDYTGTVPKITLMISDGIGSPVSTDILFEIAPINDSPTFVAPSKLRVDYGGYSEIDILSHITDSDSSIFTLDSIEISDHGSVIDLSSGESVTTSLSGIGVFTASSSGLVRFTPFSGYFGSVPDVVLTFSDDSGGVGSGRLVYSDVLDTSNSPHFWHLGPLPSSQNTIITGNIYDHFHLTPDERSRTTISGFSFASSADRQQFGTTTIDFDIPYTMADIGTFTFTASGDYEFRPLSGYTGSIPTIEVSMHSVYSTTDPEFGSDRNFLIYFSDITPADFTDIGPLTILQDTPYTGDILSSAPTIGSPFSISGFVVSGDTTVHSAGSASVIDGIGTFTISPNGIYTFTPVADYHGSVPSIDVTIMGSDSSIHTVTLSFSPIADITDSTLPDSLTLSPIEDMRLSGNIFSGIVDMDDETLTVTGFTIGSDSVIHASGTDATITGIVPIGSFTISSIGDYSFTPASDYYGSVPSISILVSDESSDTATLTLTFADIGNVFDSPTLSPITDSVLSDGFLSWTDTATIADYYTDSDSQERYDVFSVDGSASNVNMYVRGSTGGYFIISSTGDYAFYPSDDFVGLSAGESRETSISVTVSDITGRMAKTTYTVTVMGVDDSSILTGTIPTRSDTSGTDIQPYDIATLFGISDTSLTRIYTAEGLPDGLSIDSSTGLVSGTLSRLSGYIGEHLTRVHLLDSTTSEIRTIMFRWSVSPNSDSLLSSPSPDSMPSTLPSGFRVGNEFYTPTGSSIDFSPLSDNSNLLQMVPPPTIEIIESPTNGSLSILSFNIFHYDPTLSTFTGTDSFTYRATDVSGRVFTEEIIINVGDVPPGSGMGSGDDVGLPKSIVAQNRYTYTDSFPLIDLSSYIVDLDSDLSFTSPLSLPMGLVFDSTTGKITGTLPSDATGIHEFSTTFADGREISFDITIEPFTPDLISIDRRLMLGSESFVRGDLYSESNMDMSGSYSSDLLTLHGTSGESDSRQPIDSSVRGTNGGILTVSEFGEYLFSPGTDFNDLSLGESRTTTFIYYMHISGDPSRVFSETLTITVDNTNVAPNSLVFRGTTTEHGELSISGGIRSGLLTTPGIDGNFNDVLIITSVNGDSDSVASDIRGSDGGIFSVSSDGGYEFRPGTDFADLRFGETRETSVILEVTDSRGLSSTSQLIITVSGTDDGIVVSPINSITASSGSSHVSPLLSLSDYITDIDGDTITYTTTSDLPDGLTLNSDGTITGTISFTAASGGDSGVYRISVLATESGSDTSRIVTFDITITATPPLAPDATITLGEDSTITGNVISDNVQIRGADPNTLSVIGYSSDLSGFSAPASQDLSMAIPLSSGGTLLMSSDGTYTFSTNSDFDDLPRGSSRTTSAIYYISDSDGLSARGLISFTVTGENDAPTVEPISITTDQNTIYDSDSATNLLSSSFVSDVDSSDSLTVHSVSGSLLNVGFPIAGSDGGMFTISIDGSYIFDPSGDFVFLGDGESATTSIMYEVSDRNGAKALNMLEVTVTGTDDSIVVSSVPVLRTHDGAVHTISSLVSLQDYFTDPDSSLPSLSFRTDSLLPSGLVLNLDGTITGTVSSDASGLGASGLYTLSVTATDDSTGTQYVLSVSIDIDNRPPLATDSTFTLTASSSHTGNLFTSMIATDGGLDTDVLEIIGYRTDISDTTTPVSQILSPSDFSAGGVLGSMGGIFYLTSTGDFRFSTNDDFASLGFGSTRDSQILYFVRDSQGSVSRGILTFTVIGENDSPTTSPATATTTQDSVHTVPALSGLLTHAADIDGDALTISSIGDGSVLVGESVSGSDGGLFTIMSDGSYTFDPNGDFVDLAAGETRVTTITYEISDTHDSTTTGILTMTVIGFDDPIVVSPIDRIITQDGASYSSVPLVDLSDYVTDTDGDAITFSLVSSSILPFSLYLNPDGRILGDVFPQSSSYSSGSLTVHVLARTATGSEASFSFDLSVENIPPDAVHLTYRLSSGESISVPSVFSASLGNDAITDGGDDSDTLFILGFSSDLDDMVPPTDQDLSVGVRASSGGMFRMDRSGSLRFTASDSDFADLSIGETRETSIRYFVGDIDGGVSSSLVTFTIEGKDDLFTSFPDALSTTPTTILRIDSASGILSNDGDPDNSGSPKSIFVSHVSNDALNIGKSVLGSSGGLFTIYADGSYIFDPSDDFLDLGTGDIRETRISYTSGDGLGGRDISYLSITVVGTNDAPIISGPITARASSVGDTIEPIDLSSIFAISDSTTLTYIAENLPSGLSLDSTTGMISGVLSESSAGFHDVRVYSLNPDTNEIRTTNFVWDISTTTTALPDLHLTRPLSSDGTTIIPIYPFTGFDSSDWSSLRIISFTDPHLGLLTLSDSGTNDDLRDFSRTFIYEHGRGLSDGTTTFAYTISDSHGNTYTREVSLMINSRNIVGDIQPLRTESITLDTNTRTLTNGEFISGISTSGYFSYTGYDSVSYSADNLPLGLLIDSVTGVISGTVDTDTARGYHSTTDGTTITTLHEYPVRVIATSSSGDQASITFDLSVSLNPPTPSPDSVTTSPNTPVTIVPLINDSDSDGDSLFVESFTSPINGDVILNSDGTLVYTGNTDFTGTDTFTVVIGDNKHGRTESTITVSVVSDTSTSLSFSNTLSFPDTSYGAPFPSLDISANFTNPSSVSITYGALNLPSGLTIDSTTGIISGAVTADAHTHSPYAVTLYATDATGNQTTTTLELTVTNLPPVLTNNIGYTATNAPLTFFPLIDDSDPEGDSLSLQSVRSTSGSSVSLNTDGSFTYIPVSGFTGTDTIIYTAADSADTTTEGEVTIHVGDVPLGSGILSPISPIIIGDDYDYTAGLISLSDYITDPEGDSLTFRSTNLPTGLMMSPSGLITGIVSSDASSGGIGGIYTITVDATDSDGTTTTLLFDLVARDLHPITSDGVYTLSQTGTRSGNIFSESLIRVTNPDALPLSVVSYTNDLSILSSADIRILPTSISGSSGGVLEMRSDGTYTFVAGTDFEDLVSGESRSTSIAYFVSDGAGGMARGILTFTIEGADDSPRLSPIRIDTDQNTVRTATAESGILSSSYDPDSGDTLAITAVGGSSSNVGVTISGSTGGEFTIDADGSYTFDPLSDFDSLRFSVGRLTSVSYEVTDSQGNVSVSELTVRVEGLDDPVTIAPLDRVEVISGSSYSLDLNDYVFDVDGTSFLFSSRSEFPDGLQLTGSGLLTGTISQDAHLGGESGVYTVTIAAYPATGDIAYFTFDISVISDSSSPDPDPSSPAPISPPIVSLSVSDVSHSTRGSESFSGNIFDSGYVDYSSGDLSDVFVSYYTKNDYVTSPLTDLPTEVRGSSGGLFTLSVSGSYSFSPLSDFTDLRLGESRSTSIFYFVSDSNGDYSRAMMTFTVTGVPTPTSVTVDQGSDTITGRLFSRPFFSSYDVSVRHDGIATTGILSGGGSLVLHSDGRYEFSVSDSYNHLSSGETYVERLDYTVTLSDNTRYESTFTFIITGTNDEPHSISSIPSQVVLFGEPIVPLSLSGYFSDIDTTDTLTITISESDLPLGLSYDSSTFTISGVVSSGAVLGDHRILITAFDTSGSSTTTSVIYTVVDPAPPPPPPSLPQQQLSQGLREDSLTASRPVHWLSELPDSSPLSSSSSYLPMTRMMESLFEKDEWSDTFDFSTSPDIFGTSDDITLGGFIEVPLSESSVKFRIASLLSPDSLFLSFDLPGRSSVDTLDFRLTDGRPLPEWIVRHHSRLLSLSPPPDSDSLDLEFFVFGSSSNLFIRVDLPTGSLSLLESSDSSTPLSDSIEEVVHFERSRLRSLLKV